MFPYNFFDLPPLSSTPRGPIDTKSFSTRETTGKFVLVKFESNNTQTGFEKELFSIRGFRNIYIHF
jgi:hypothetical protein